MADERLSQSTPETQQARVDEVVPKLLYHVATPQKLHVFSSIPSVGIAPLRTGEIAARAAQKSRARRTSSEATGKTVSRVLTTSFSFHGLVGYDGYVGGYVLTPEGTACRDTVVSAAESFYAKHPEVQGAILGESLKEIKSAVRILRTIREETTTIQNLAKKLSLTTRQATQTIERLQNSGILSPSEVLEIENNGMAADVLSLLVDPIYTYVESTTDLGLLASHPDMQEHATPVEPQDQTDDIDEAELERRFITTVNLATSMNDQQILDVHTQLQDDRSSLVALFRKDSHRGINVLRAIEKRNNILLDTFVRELLYENRDVIAANFSQLVVSNSYWANRYYDIANDFVDRYDDRQFLTQLDASLRDIFQSQEGTLCATRDGRQMLIHLLTTADYSIRSEAAQIVERHLDDYIADERYFNLNNTLRKAFPYFTETAKEIVAKRLLRDISTRRGSELIKSRTLLEDYILAGAIGKKELSEPTKALLHDILGVFGLEYRKLEKYWSTYLGDGETLAYAAAKNIQSILWIEANRKNFDDMVTKTLSERYKIVHFRRWGTDALLRQFETRDDTTTPQVVFISRHDDYYKDADNASLDQAIASHALNGRAMVRGYEAESGYDAVRIINAIVDSGQETPFVVIDAIVYLDHFLLGEGRAGEISVGLLRNRRSVQRLAEKWAGKFTLVLGSCYAGAHEGEDGESYDTNIAQIISEKLRLRVIAGRGLSLGVYFPNRFGPLAPMIKGTTTVLYENGQEIREIR